MNRIARYTSGLFIYLILITSCTTASWKDAVFSYPAERWDLEVALGWCGEELYPELFSIPFTNSLRRVNGCDQPFRAINFYTTARLDEKKGYSGFLDPKSPYKDSWFDIMIIRDTKKARKELLFSPEGDPDDPENLAPGALCMLPAADQTLIFSLSQWGVEGTPRWSSPEEVCRLKPGSISADVVPGPGNSPWLRIDSVLETRSALTDPAKSRMSPWLSFRFYTGVPTREILSQVSPWHPVELPGRLYARRVNTAQGGVFCLVFFNGSRFTTLDGEFVDTWTESLINTYERMFQTLTLKRLSDGPTTDKY